MKICYTVCSLNRFGQILVLSKTFLKHNPDYKFFACLVDKIDDRINPQLYPFIEFIPFSSLPLTNKQELSDKYDIFELSCASKAFFGKYLIQKYNPEILVYLDTDICVYDNFLPVEQQLPINSILITPHFSKPVADDGKYPLERDVLNSGLYNGGFFAVKNNDESRTFFEWWQERLLNQGFNNVCEGMMVDQLWLNLVPIYFSNTKIFKHPGCNLAYWNFPERELKLRDGKYFVNEQPLIFFHFSGYRIDHPKRLSGHQNRVNELDNPFLSQIIEEYYHLLIENNFAEYLSFSSHYGRKKTKKKVSLLKKGIIEIFASFGYSLERIRRVK